MIDHHQTAIHELTNLKEYDPYLESLGFDEANLDVTEYLWRNGFDSPEGWIFVGQKIR